MSAKKTPAPIDRRSQQAIDSFEKAMKALGKHDYEKARELFDAILAGFPEERDLLERARSYRALCERQLDKRPAFRPKTFDEMLHHGVYLHNRGEYEEALKFLRQAAEIHPRNEHVLYCLAATAARSGDSATALKNLRQAVTAGGANRAQARQDPDFDALRDDEEFLSIVYPQAS
jgi:tetratricopeptide (TPR) repeat protein